MHHMRSVHLIGTWRRWCSVGAAIAATSLLAAAAPTLAATPRQRLLALAGKMRDLRLSSVRAEGDWRVTGKHLTGALKKLRGYSISVDGELAEGPPRANLSLVLDGRALLLRVVEGKAYIEDPSLAAKDNGRPWVSEAISSGPLLGAGAAEGAGLAEVGLRKTAVLLSSAARVKALGESTLEGQVVHGFAATIPASVLERERVTKSVRTVLEQAHDRSSASFEIFIAADGLPLRAVYTLHVGPATVHSQSDITATNFPVTVLAPPVGETITASELEALEADGHFG
jgi:hypothetical protein